MKRGMILYVTEGRERIGDWPELDKERKLLGADAVCLASSESEIAYGWWRLLVSGMQEVSCVRAVYDESRHLLEPWGMPLRLCG